jgi:hypothetical protein
MGRRGFDGHKVAHCSSNALDRNVPREYYIFDDTELSDKEKELNG